MKSAARKRAEKVIGDRETSQDVIHRALLSLERDGRITPESVIVAAQNPKSPLHDRFEWDDSVAAHEHRLQQARGLIRSVMVQITTEERIISTVHYVRDPSVGDDQGYVSLAKLQTEPENARAMLMHSFGQAKTYLGRAEEFAAVLGHREAVVAVSKKLNRVATRIESEIGISA